jgi:predicted O-methyltransferase YrrM
MPVPSATLIVVKRRPPCSFKTRIAPFTMSSTICAERFCRGLFRGATRARTIVEFGTSFGISTIYLASALRDNGGGHLITCELEAAKSQRSQAHLAEVGLSDLVEFRIGDALEVLNQGISSPVDMLLLDGAKPLYFRVLKLIEPFLRQGALITSDNINTRMKVSEFTDYIRQPVNGYISVAVPLEDGIELSMRTAE